LMYLSLLHIITTAGCSFRSFVQAIVFSQILYWIKAVKKEDTVNRTPVTWIPPNTCIKITRFKAGPISSKHIDIALRTFCVLWRRLLQHYAINQHHHGAAVSRRTIHSHGTKVHVYLQMRAVQQIQINSKPRELKESSREFIYLSHWLLVYVLNFSYWRCSKHESYRANGFQPVTSGPTACSDVQIWEVDRRSQNDSPTSVTKIS
jgi:hypothetical protein